MLVWSQPGLCVPSVAWPLTSCCDPALPGSFKPVDLHLPSPEQLHLAGDWHIEEDLIEQALSETALLGLRSFSLSFWRHMSKRLWANFPLGKPDGQPIPCSSFSLVTGKHHGCYLNISGLCLHKQYPLWYWVPLFQDKQFDLLPDNSFCSCRSSFTNLMGSWINVTSINAGGLWHCFLKYFYWIVTAAPVNCCPVTPLLTMGRDVNLTLWQHFTFFTTKHFKIVLLFWCNYVRN